MQIYPITVELNNIQELLVAPQDNPFQPNFRLMSGIEEIVQIMRTRTRREGVDITLVLPAGTLITPDAETQLHSAVVRYCDAQIKRNQLELEAGRVIQWRRFRFGLLLLGLSLLVASAISNTAFLADWLKSLLSNVIGVLGTVALWSPTEALLFGWSPLLKKVRIYEILKGVTLKFRVASSTQ